MSKSDQHIKDLFENYKIDYDPSSWSAMEEKINTELEPEANFDKEIQEKLFSHTEIYDHSSWPILEQKMADRAALRQKIIITKSLEVLAIFLLIFSAGNYSNTPLLPKKDIHYALQSGQDNNNLDQESAIHLDTNTTNPTETIYRETSTIEQGPNIRNEQATVSTELLDAKPIQGIESSNIAISRVEQDASYNNQIRYQVNLAKVNEIEMLPHSSPLSELYITSIATSTKDKDNVATSDIDNKAESTISPEHKITNLTSIPDIRPEFLDINILEKSLATIAHERNDLPNVKALSILKLQSRSEQRKHYISAVASVDVNLINRPLDFQLLQDPINYGDVGQSLGVLYASKQGRHEIETGLLYSQQTTNPNQTEKISIDNSYYDREFNLQKFDLFKIPLDIKYHFVDTRESNFYVSIGLDLHIIGDASYEFTDRLKSGTPKPKSKIENRSTLAKRKDLKGGLFDGGSLKNNTFVNVGGGIGYMYHLGDFSLFTEANYKHHIFAAKLGPNNEKIHTLSFKTGVRKRI